MTEAPGPRYARPLARTSVVLALLAYLPALTAAPGRMPSDSKLYLYLDPGRFIADAASTFDGRQFAGWVPHQHVAYLWPSAPWFWLFETLGVPDWIAHRLWIGSIMLAAGLGVRWCARLLGVGPMAAFAAAIVYQLSLYVLPYVSRTSVMLLPWAGLGWIVAFTIRASRRRTWSDPAAIALVVLTVGAVNATALAMIIPAPTWWLLHAAWRGSIAWREAALVAVRVGVLSVAVSLWWIVMLVIQGRFGTDVLPYSESLADVSLTATSSETWRGLGYWLFYVRDPYAATTTESLRYLTSSFSIAVSYVLPIAALVALAWGRWVHRRFAAGLIGIGLVLAVGVHPVGDRSPLMRLLAGDDDGGLALALRSSTRALPVMMLGLALALAMAVEASRGTALSRFDLRASSALGVAVALVAVVNLPALWTGGFVDPVLERDEHPPSSWLDAAAALDATGDSGRVLQLPGAEFGAYRWGYTVDQPLPGLTEKPLVTRDLLPLGSGLAMDLVFALDDRVQDGVLDPDAVAPIARLLGVDTIWLTNDLEFERFRTARPDVVRDLVVDAPGTGPPIAYGEPSLHPPEIPATDERAIADPRVGDPAPDVELVPIDRPGRIVRAAADVLVVSGSGDGLVDAAASGLLDGTDTVVRYSADLGSGTDETIDEAIDRAVGLIVTDSNRDRARHWRGSQDTTGFTEPGGPDPGVLRPVASDARLDVFDTSDQSTQTIAVQRGPVTATATAYGEPFAYLPEHRPFMAVDGDLDTAWLVGEHGDPVAETLRLEFERPIDRLVLHQPLHPNDRHITRLSYRSDGRPGVDGTLALDEASWSGTGAELRLPGAVTSIDLTIDAVAGGTPFTASAVSPVGFTEVVTDLGPATEVVRPPVHATDDIAAGTPLAYVLTRLRVDPMDRWRDDPEPTLVREIDLATDRDLDVDLTGRIDARATDHELASFFDWPATASTRLTGSLRHPGVAALDGDDDTAWITAFGAATGATLSTSAASPIATIEVRQPVSGFSTATGLTVRAAGEERVVRLEPDAAGNATAVIDPPLPPGPVEFVLSDVDEEVTIDRRFGDPVTLPASIVELRFDGQPTVAPIDTAVLDLPCTTIAEIDGVAVAATIEVGDAAWLDGEPIGIEPCAPSVRLGAGRHLIRGSAGSVPITLDRVVLDDGVRAALDDTAPAPPVDVVEAGRFDRTVRVGPCPDGCWLVLGEGVNEAWSASGPEGGLGAPVAVDGGFNGWWIAPSEDATVVEMRWTAQRALNWALVLSALGAVSAIWLVVRERARRDAGPTRVTIAAPAPVWSWGPATPVGRRRAVVLTAVWTTASVLLVGPQWALCGLLGGAAIALMRRGRLVELTALASLIVVAAIVVVRERRTAPLPNGGWPGTFDSLHGLGMFAVACVIVAALTADDADAADRVGEIAELAAPADPRTPTDA